MPSRLANALVLCLAAATLIGGSIFAGRAVALQLSGAHAKQQRATNRGGKRRNKPPKASERSKASMPLVNRTRHRATMAERVTGRWFAHESDLEYEIVDGIASQASLGEAAVALGQQTIQPIPTRTEFAASERPVPLEAALTSAQKLAEEAEETAGFVHRQLKADPKVSTHTWQSQGTVSVTVCARNSICMCTQTHV